MNSKHTLSISEARKKFFDIAEEVQQPDTYYILTEKGKPKVVIMSVEEFELWQETLEVYKQFPDLASDIKQLDKELKSGAWKTYPTLEQVMAKQGFMVADKARNNYEVSNKNKTKSKKTTR